MPAVVVMFRETWNECLGRSSGLARTASETGVEQQEQPAAMSGMTMTMQTARQCQKLPAVVRSINEPISHQPPTSARPIVPSAGVLDAYVLRRLLGLADKEIRHFTDLQ